MSSSSSPEPVWLNLGCGGNAPLSWQNYDRSPMLLLRKWRAVRTAALAIGLLTDDHMGGYPDNIQRRNLARGLPYADGTVHAIYSSHMLEHLYLNDARRLVAECYRVLAPGAVIRLALPDGQQWARELLESDDEDSAGERYNAMLRAHPEDKPSGRRLVTFVGGANYHKWQPTRGLVRGMLETVGFTGVTEHSFQAGTLPEIELVELREDSMFFEAAKPG